MNKAIEIAFLSLGFVAVAGAQMTARDPVTNPGNQKVTPQFSSLDSDKDGHVTRSEVKAHADLNDSFAALDTNGDSWLSEAELRKWRSSSTSDVPLPETKSPADPKQAESAK